jgi:RNA polymerase sigma-70 factor, ECF subfamily
MGVRRAATVTREDADERLMVEAAQRDPGKFGALYELHFAKVYAYISHRVQNRTTAEDLTSEVFHKALANVGQFEWRGAPFAAWLLRIAANAIADQSKRAARESQRVEDPPEPGAKPDLEIIEQRAKMFRLVEQLPREQRRVIFERFVEQKSIREIAQGLEKSEGAVKQLQFRALQSLRTRMEGADA